MATDFGARRSSSSLKTYSKRVKNKIPQPTERKVHTETDSNKEGLLGNTQRSVVAEEEEDQVPVSCPGTVFKKQQKEDSITGLLFPVSQILGKSQIPETPSTKSPSSILERHPFNAIDKNHINNSAELSLSIIKPHNHLTSNHSPDTTRKQEEPALPILPQSAGEAKYLTQQASQQASKDPPETVSKKRRKGEAFEAHSAPEFKRAKHSSITSYFKPLPSSSSPSTTRSANVFSDNLEPPSSVSSPLSSPVVGGESPHYQKRTQKRRLTTKPSRLSPVTMPYEKYRSEDDWVYEEIVQPIDFTLSRQEQLDEQNSASYRKAHQAPLPVPRVRRPTNSFYVLNESSPTISSSDGKNATTFNAPTEDPQSIVNDINTPPPTAQKTKSKVVHYKQSQLTSEREVIEYCHDCNLMYNRTDHRDVRDHNKMHTAITRGSSIHRPSADCIILENHLEGVAHRVYVSRHHSNLNTKLWFEHALYVSKMGGLEGIVPTNSELWSEVPISAQSGNHMVPRYKTYVYTIDMQIIAVILAERIERGGAFYSGSKTHDASGPLLVADKDRHQEYVSRDSLYDVYVSVDRIWTRQDQRRMKYATTLLDHVRKDFIPGTTLEKDKVAFSYPTTNGRNFAKEYFKDVFPDCDFAINLNDAPIVVEGGKFQSGYRQIL